LTTASKVTLTRIAMVPVFMIFMARSFDYSDIVGLVIFIIASVTDSVDGYIARKYDQISDFGKFIDPLADKLLVTAAILIFVERGQMAAWAAMIIITREFAVTALRLVAVEGGLVIAAGTSGKIKTVVSIVAICFMITPWHTIPLIPSILDVNGLCILLIVVTTVWSGVEYFVKNWSVMSFKK